MKRRRIDPQRERKPRRIAPSSDETETLPRSNLARCPACGGPCGAYHRLGPLRYRKCAGWRDITGCGHTFSEAASTQHNNDWSDWLEKKQAEREHVKKLLGG